MPAGAADGGDGNSDRVGGLVGWNGGTITASYARRRCRLVVMVNSTVSGGLVGFNIDGTITASYASGDVDGGNGR